MDVYEQFVIMLYALTKLYRQRGDINMPPVLSKIETVWVIGTENEHGQVQCSSHDFSINSFTATGESCE